MSRYLLFFPQSGHFAGETNTKIGVARAAAQLLFGKGGQKRHKEISVEQASDDPKTLLAWYDVPDEMRRDVVLIAQPEKHPDIVTVQTTGRRWRRGN